MKQQTMSVKRINAIVSLLFAAILVGSILLWVQTNRKNAEMACGMILDQMEDVITANEQDIEVLMATLKDEYGVRANLVANLLDQGVGANGTQADYQAVAEQADVEELHIFNSEGTIVNGTTPTYYGFNFNAGDQMHYFLPMLKDRDLTMCQDMTPNTAEGKPMMYAITWNSTKEWMVQVGVTPNHLLQVKEHSSLTQAIARMPVTEGMMVCILNDETKEVLGCTSELEQGCQESLSQLMKNEPAGAERRYTIVKLGDTPRYIAYETFEEMDIAVSYSVEVANDNIGNMTAVLFLTLALSLLIINVVTRKTVGALEESRNQLAEAKTAAEQANAAKTSFLSRMSHDIRTPLNGIIGLLKIDENHPDDLALLQANRRKIAISADHLLSLINDVLQMSKLEAGEVTLAHEALDLNELSVSVLTIVDQRATEEGITMEYLTPPEKVVYPYVYGSPLHLRQLFLNIYTNCIKYNKPHGKISTSFAFLGLENGIVTYRWIIADTGIGMSQEFLQHIFEPFSQEHSDARSVYKGTGLGMAIVKTLLDKMHGTIDITSTLGEGSTFVITLPFPVAQASDVAPAQQKVQEADIYGLHLLLAEDNDLNAEIAQVLLEEAGAEVTLVRDGQQAVDAFASHPAGTFDAILMDVMMPVKNGLDATRDIRALDRPDAKRIPILAMTANAFDEDAKACLEAGMNAHLAKPLRMEVLTGTLAVFCKQDSG